MSDQNRAAQILKQCQQCNELKPITKFTTKGSHTTTTGEKIIYRSAICRKCDRSNKTSNGICRLCYRPNAPDAHHCEKHLATMRQAAKIRNQNDRSLAFNHYGEVCAYCGQRLLLFLTIDHINNNGNEHRRQLRSGKNNGHNIYAWLRKNNYPTGFQTLCYNCNIVKSQIGEEQLQQYLKQANQG